MGQQKFWVKFFSGFNKNVLVKKLFRSKNILGQKNFFGHTFFSQKILVKKFLGQNNFLIKKIWVKKILGKEIFLIKTIWVWFFLSKKTGRVNPRGRIYNPPQKIIGLKLCWVVVCFACWPCLQNFRPLGLLFLVELEFLVGWWGGGGGVKW